MFALLLVLAVGLTPSAHALNVSNCLDLGAGNDSTTYTLTGNIVVDGDVDEPVATTGYCFNFNGAYNITIDGNGYSITDTSGGGDALSYAGLGIYNSNNITIKNLTISNDWYGNEVYSGNVTITDNTFLTPLWTGYDTLGQDNLVVSNNYIETQSFNNEPTYEHSAESGESTTVTFTGNTLNQNSAMDRVLRLYSGGVNEFQGLFTNNVINGATAMAYRFDFFASGGSYGDLTFTNNSYNVSLNNTVGNFTGTNTFSQNTYTNENATGHSDTCTNDGFDVCEEPYDFSGSLQDSFAKSLTPYSFELTTCKEITVPGNYYVSQNITVDGDLDPVTSGFGYCIYTENVDGVTIDGQGFTLSDTSGGGEAYSYAGVGSFDVQNFSVRNVKTNKNWYAGIEVSGTDLLVEYNDLKAPLFYNAESYDDNATIQHNTVETLGDFLGGLDLQPNQASFNVTVHNNSIKSSLDQGNALVNVFGVTGDVFYSGLVMTDNYFEYPVGGALRFFGAELTDLTFTGNTVNESSHQTVGVITSATFSGNTYTNENATGHSDTCTNDGNDTCVEPYVFLTATNDTNAVALTAYCAPNWVCIGYGSPTCLVDDTNTSACDTVNDTMSCGQSYLGNYSEFANATGVCDFCTPSWSCDGYVNSTCVVTNGTGVLTETCNSALDNNSCYATTLLPSDQYLGNFTELGQQQLACDASAYAKSQYGMNLLIMLLPLLIIVILGMALMGFDANTSTQTRRILLGITTVIIVLLLVAFL
jgi:hypothetical protein